MPIKSFASPRQLPSNNRAIDPARRALDLLAPYQQRKYEAAFFVNPIEILLYSKLNGGIECSCTFGDYEAPAAPILGEDGKASPATIQTLLTGNRFGITEYGTVHTDANTRDNPVLAAENLDGVSSSNLTYVETVPGSPRSTVDNEYGSLGANYVVNGLEDELQIDAPDTHLESEQLNRSLRSTDNRSCPICLGSGYVGGFTIHGGFRRVYDCRDSGLTIVKGEIDAIKSPNRALVNFDGYAEFLVQLPANIQSVDAFRVMNGKQAAKNVTVSARSIGGVTFTAMNSLVSIRSVCTGQQKLIRISSLDGTNPFQFTHLELQFNLSSVPLLAEYPKFGESSDMSLLDKLSEVQINLTNKVVSLHPEDLIYDSSVSRLWRVSAAQFYRDHSQNVIGWDCNASVVQPYETTNILPRRVGQRSRHQKHNSSIRQTLKP